MNSFIVTTNKAGSTDQNIVWTATALQAEQHVIDLDPHCEVVKVQPRQNNSFAPIYQCTTDSGLMCQIFRQPQGSLVNMVMLGMDDEEPRMKNDLNFVDAMAAIAEQVCHDLGAYIDDAELPRHYSDPRKYESHKVV